VSADGLTVAALATHIAAADIHTPTDGGAYSHAGGAYSHAHFFLVGGPEIGIAHVYVW
jgi:hypothetical protein